MEYQQFVNAFVNNKPFNGMTVELYDIPCSLSLFRFSDIRTGQKYIPDWTTSLDKNYYSCHIREFLKEFLPRDGYSSLDDWLAADSGNMAAFRTALEQYRQSLG